MKSQNPLIFALILLVATITFALGQVAETVVIPTTIPAGTYTLTPVVAPPTTQPTPPVSPPTTQPTPPVSPPIVVAPPTTGPSYLNPVPPAPIGAPITGVAAITASNPQGIPIYPLDGVFVNATHGGTLTPLQLFLAMANPNGGIFWDFGDPGSEADQMIGFNAAHYYKSAGQKTVTLTVVPMVITPKPTAPFFAVSNGPSFVATTSVTVAQENRPTVNIQAGQAIPKFLNGTRYIFEGAANGTTWNCGDGGAFNVAGLANVYIGTNGNPVTMFATDPTNTALMVNSDASSAGVTIQGITFDADKTKFGNPNSAPCNIGVATIQGNGGMTFLNDTVLNMGNFIYNQLSPAANELVQDCACPLTNGLVGYGMYNVATDVSLIDDSFNGSQIQWVLRDAPNTTASTLTDLEIFGGSVNYSGVTTGKGGIRIMTGVDCCVYGVTLTGPSSLGTNGAGPALECDPSETDNPLAENVAFVSNKFANGCISIISDAGNVTNGVADYIAVVNNQQTQSLGGQQMVFANVVYGRASNLYVIGNTAIASAGVGTTLANFSKVTSGFLLNNWLVDPGDGAVPVVIDKTSDLVNCGNLWPAGSKPTVGGNSVTETQWNQESLSGGANPADVFEDQPLGTAGQATVNGVTYGCSLGN